MPTAESEAPAMKLAEAEKHIEHDPFVVSTSVQPTSNGDAGETIECGGRRNSLGEGLSIPREFGTVRT
ncbi:MAG TPA: hypothetical protein VFB28_08360 [Terriglobales bacterium]|nr:hypothetical protein [Terriglobales bacterium]